MDELLDRAGSDPLTGRLKLLRNQPRAAAVLKAVAQRANWKVPRLRTAMLGELHWSRASTPFAAQIAEVSVDENGEPKSIRFGCRHCGVVVNPDVVRRANGRWIGYGDRSCTFTRGSHSGRRRDGFNFHDYRSRHHGADARRLR